MTQATKGTFLQLPSVFIETCDLPETAQILYIRMLHTFGYKGVYTGSLRKLANVVRMSKSTVDRMLDVLSASHLISRANSEASETAQNILQISLDPEYLWNMNIDYCTSHTVPIWDSSKKDKVSQDRTKCPNLGRAVPLAGQAVPFLGQAVPTRTLKRAPNITNTSKTNKTKKDSLVVSASAENNGDVSLSLSSSLEEERDTQPLEVLPEEGLQNGNAPTGAFQRADDPEERPMSALPRGHASEGDGLGTSPSIEQDTIPEYTAQENSLATHKTLEESKIQTRTGAKTGSTKKKGDTRTPEEKIRCQSWQAFFNARRGGEPLHKVGPRIDESDCIIVLVQKFSDAEITAIDTFVLTEKYPYTKPSEKHKVGARIVLDEYQNARECLKERGQWPGETPLEEKREMPTFTPAGYDAADEFGAYWGINELRTVSHAAF